MSILVISIVGFVAHQVVAQVALSQPIQPKQSHKIVAQDHFNGARAFEVLKRYVHLGNRHYTAADRPKIIKQLREELSATVDQSTVSIQSTVDHFTAIDRPTAQSYELANIIVRLHPERTQRVLLGTHWDTRLWAEEDPDPTRRDQPITGANDGTSGLAVLFELSRLAQVTPLNNLGIDLVLFDGEEFGRPKSDDYCQGSKHFASNLSRWYRQPPLAVFVLDMVGDRELTLPPERSSLTRARALTQMVYNVAQSLGSTAFTMQHLGPWIVDDHTPFQALGIPALLLIDYDYAAWHTHQDTIDRCSPESLEQVGRVIWETLKKLDLNKNP